jgi:hypothetical protein
MMLTTFIQTYTYIYVYTNMYIQIYIYMYINVYMCIYIYICICLCISMNMVSSGHLEEQVVIAIELLLKYNESETIEEEENEITVKNVVNDLSRLNVNNLHYDSIASLLTSRGYLGQFYWSLKNDFRIMDLLNHACDRNITGSMCLTSNSDSNDNLCNNDFNASLDLRLSSLDSSIKSTSPLDSPKRLSSLNSSVKSMSSDIPEEPICVKSEKIEKIPDREKIEERNILRNVQQILKVSASKIAFICRVEI